MTRTARSLCRDRLRLAGGERLAEQRVLGRGERRVLMKHPRSALVGALEQRRILGQLREGKAREAGLAGAGQLPLPSELEVDLGETEPVGVLGERLETQRLGRAEEQAQRRLGAAA